MVSGYPNAVFASFNSWLDAKEFYEDKDGPPLSVAIEESIGHIPIVISSLSALPVPPSSVASPSLTSAHSNMGNSSLVPLKPSPGLSLQSSPGLSLQSSPGLSGLTRSRPNKADDGNIVSTMRNALAVSSSNVLVTSSSSCSTPSSDHNMSPSTKHNLVDACSISTASSSDSVSVSGPLGISSAMSSSSDKNSCSLPSLPEDLIARLQKLISGKPPVGANRDCLEEHVNSLHSSLRLVLETCGAPNKLVPPSALSKPTAPTPVINSLESFVCKELGDNSHFLDILSSHPGFFLSPADTRGLTKAQAQAYIKLDRRQASREDPLTILEAALGQSGATFSMVQKLHFMDLVARVTKGQGDCGTLALLTSATGQSDPTTELELRRALVRYVKQALDTGREVDLVPFGFDGQFATTADRKAWESRVMSPTGNLEANDLMLMGELMGVHVGIFNASSNVDGPANSPDNLCCARGTEPNVFLLYEPPGKGGRIGHYSSVTLNKSRNVLLSVQSIRDRLTSLGSPPDSPLPAVSPASALGAVLAYCKGSMSTLDTHLHHIRTLVAAEKRKRESASRTGWDTKGKASLLRLAQDVPAGTRKPLLDHVPPPGRIPAPAATSKSLLDHVPPPGRMSTSTEEQRVRLCNFVRSGQSCPFLHRFGTCKFAHKPSTEICRQFQLRGICEYGTGCRYTHSFSPHASSAPRPLAGSNTVTAAAQAPFQAQAQVVRPRLSPPASLANGRKLHGSWAAGPPLRHPSSNPPLLHHPIGKYDRALGTTPPHSSQSFWGESSHPPLAYPQLKPCRFYSKGNCSFGNTCRYSHVGPPLTH